MPHYQSQPHGPRWHSSLLAPICKQPKGGGGSGGCRTAPFADSAKTAKLGRSAERCSSMCPRALLALLVLAARHAPVTPLKVVGVKKSSSCFEFVAKFKFTGELLNDKAGAWL